MRIVVAGGSGLLGRALVTSSVAAGDSVCILSRGGTAAPPSAGSPGQLRLAAWTPDGNVGPWAAEVRGADAVVNLAGHSIGAARWSPRVKARILESRLLATRSLVEAVVSAGDRPPAFLSASAVGYYGTSGDEMLTEQAGPGRGFLSEVCIRWEQEALRAERSGARVVLLRTGVVLASDGGALPQLVRPFRFLAGGRIGSGSQYLSWIHVSDWVGLVRWLASRGDVKGAVNLTAPGPATNAAFVAAIGRALGRSAWMPVPAFALRLAFGEMADEMLLGGQRVVPDRALALGYRFAFSELDRALRDLLA